MGSRWFVVLALLASLALACEERPAGRPGFASPHAAPLALSPTEAELYVVNTAADRLEVIDTRSRRLIRSIPTGIDPVSVAVRPDGKEVWVSNHISDTVSVVDVDRKSATRYAVIDTVTEWDESGQVTRFDEPVGIAFADDSKAYVALSSRNRIAVVDVASRSVVKQIPVFAQEPRALLVRDGRLYVIPFESGNRTELSGCLTPRIDPLCTFSLFVLQNNSNDAILTRNMVADIIRRPGAPDRDLFVYDTTDDSRLFEVSSIGTLLYGLAVDSKGQVFIAQTEARNDDNGLAGTAGHDLVDIENRMFLNQIARVDCSGDCDEVSWIDLEPLPPQHPRPSEALATPFGIGISDDDSTIVSVAAGSSRLFTLDAGSGAVLGTTPVGAIPRGLVLESDSEGAPALAWVLNAVENSVSLVDVSDPTAPLEKSRIGLVDPTHRDVKQGRIAFNDAAGSTTGTFSCASCHPDGNTDQLLWNLGSKCITPGCDQAQPRTTMPIRGLRGTLPLHWDGVPGDPFGGINAELADSGQEAEPNCTDEHSCFRDLVDGAMSGTMCDQTGCPEDSNERGLPGSFSEAERDAMAVFLRSVPYPPARSRPLDDRFTELAAEGWRQFVVGTDEAHPGCSRAGACHAMPFWAGTNTRGTGFDAPTFRGLTDRHLLLPNGRAGMWPLLQLRAVNDVPRNPNRGPDELYSWGMTFGSENFPLANRSSLGTGPFALFQLFEEGSTGFSATFGRQVTLNATTTSADQVDATRSLLQRLEEADDEGVIDLRAEGVRLNPAGRALGPREPLSLAYEDGSYRAGPRVPLAPMTGDELIEAASSEELLVTVTAQVGPHSDVEHPQPELWLSSQAPDHPAADFFLARIPELTTQASFTLFGRYVVSGAIVLVDGHAVDGAVSCEIAGVLPACQEETLRIELASLPAPGEHTVQLGTPGGLLSNEVPLDVR
jgi:YVTN family beta-propeller protein